MWQFENVLEGSIILFLSKTNFPLTLKGSNLNNRECSETKLVVNQIKQ